MQVIKKILPYLVIIFLVFLLFNQCSKNKAAEDSRESVEVFLNDTISYYTNELNQEVAEKAAINGDKEALQVLLSKQIDSTGQLNRLVSGFRSVNAAGNITTLTIIDSIFVPYDSPIQDSNSFEKIFQQKTGNYSISGLGTNRGININHMEIPNTLSFVIGEMKTGFFKSEYRIEAVNSNPHIKTIGLDTYTYKVPHKRLGVSLYVGYGVSDNFTFKPSAGIALTYTLFRF